MTALDAHWIHRRPSLPRAAGRRTSLYLTMRDGVRIALDVHLPPSLAPGQRVPAILRQTRYFRSIELSRPLDRPAVRDLFEITGPLREQALARGYAWVDVDVRGSGVSSGSWPVPWAPDEVRDGAEVVDFVVRQPWSNGRVGATGISYDGTTAEMLLVNQHPAVRAIVPRFSLFDVFEDVAFPGGVHLAWFTAAWSLFNRRLDDHRFHEAIAGIVDTILRGGAAAPGSALRAGLRALLDRMGSRASTSVLAAAIGAMVRGGRRVDEDGDGSLRAAALRDHDANGDVHVLGARSTYRDDTGLIDAFPEHTVDTLSPSAHLDALRGSGAAVYSYGGLLDGGYGHAVVKRFMNVDGPGSRLLLGPWGHGGAVAHEPFALGRPAEFDHAFEILRFFDLHLRDTDDGIGSEPPVRYFTLGENRWKTASAWPPPGTVARTFHLGDGRRLVDEVPSGGEGRDEVVVDRSMGTGVRSRWRGVLATFVPADYPEIRARHRDALSYDSSPFDREVEVTGHPVVHVHVRADVNDVALFAYLEDVAPDGRVQYVTEGCLRALHRKVIEAPAGYRSAVPLHSFRRADAAPLEPGTPALITVALLPISYRLARGHRLRLVLAATDADHFAPPPSDLHGFAVLRSAAFPSRLELPVAP